MSDYKKEYSPRNVIENKLLLALEDGASVAILFTEADLRFMIAHLEESKGLWGPKSKGHDLLAGMKDLYEGAFG